MTDPLLLSFARSFIGVREVPGAKSNPLILNWARDIKAPEWYDDDDKAWCALFLNRILLACRLPMAGSGYDLLRAKSFETWGESLAMPALGCVMTFTRPEGAHVGLYVGERKDAYCILGGNQGNAVGLAWIQKVRLRTMRWPVGAEAPVIGRVWVDQAGVVSTNER